jgi:hypothetical protein
MIQRFLSLLPIIIMVESFLAVIPYAFSQKWGSAMYWLAAGLLNLAVIFMIKKFG